MATVWQADPLWTQQLGVFTGILLGAPAHLTVGTESVANNAARCRCVRSPALPLPMKCVGEEGISQDGRRQEQEHLWQQFFLNPSMWWDNRRDKKGSRSPDFRRKGSGEVLWLNNMLKPAWVDEQLISLDIQMGHVASPSETSSPDNPEPWRRAGSELGVVTAGTVPLLCQQGKLAEAARALESLAQTDSAVSLSLFYTVLKLCIAKKDLVVGRRVHDLCVQLGYESNAYLGNHILRMYACRGRLEEAMNVLTRVGKPDAFMWSSIISAYAKHGKPNEAVQLYHEMCRSGVQPDAHVFVAVLQACAFAADLESGRKVHCDVVQSGIPTNLIVGNCLVDMYAKCGQLEDARQVFESMKAKDVVTWTVLISGYSHQGLGHEALAVYRQMEEAGLILADHVTFSCLLKACASTGDLQEGRQLHSQIVERGLLDNVMMGTCLLDMYAKCGELGDARQVFDGLATKNVVTWTALIAGYAQQGLGQEALAVYGQMEDAGLTLANHVTFACLLKACATTRALKEGRHLESQIVERGLLGNVVLGNSLVDMYAKCGELEDARRVFQSLPTKDAVTWNVLIAGYAQQGLGQEALLVYEQMEEANPILADQVTFSCLLKACTTTGALQKGMQLHAQIVERGLLDDVVVGNCLVDMYAKFGELEDARQVFDSLATKDVVTWTALIAGYSQKGRGQDALVVYGKMEKAGLILADHVTFTCLLKACGSTGALQKGMQLHSQIVERGLLDDVVMGNCLVDMYAKCGEVGAARQVFDSMAVKDVVTWNVMIAGYAQQGLGQEALGVYEQMEETGPTLADHVTFACLLKACGSTGALWKGMQLHSEIVERGLLENMVVGSCLVDMYVKCGRLKRAHQVFDSLATKSVVTWTVLIAGYSEQGLGHEALVLYEQMEEEGLILADHVTFACLLKACGSIGALQKGMQLHSQVVERGLLDNVVVGTCLVDMYAKCGELEDARQVFYTLATKDVVTWNALIAGYTRQGLGHEALVVYGRMEEAGLVLADHVTFACLLKACGSSGALQKGMQLHSQIVKRGLLDEVVVGNCLVGMYTKCGELEDARHVFDNMATKDVVTWNTMIAGYAEQGLGQEALAVYGQMEEADLGLADHVTFSCLLKACGSSGALQKGRQLHSQIVDRGLLDDVVVGNRLVDMYVKCGELEEARHVLDSMTQRDVVTWTALIAGYGACDEGHKALGCFDEMLMAGVRPNEATFTCLLTACSHEGLVHEGCKHFDSMAERHGINPTIEHYTCMIDLLGRAGHLEEAEKMLLSCEGQSNVVGLRSLLNACKIHGDVDRALWCFERIVRLEPQDATAYVLMANAYADAGRWPDVDKIETQRRVAGANKKPAVTTIEVNKQIHRFVVGETREDIALKVKSTNARLKQEGGHLPQTNLVLKPLSENEKEDALCGHAEKLALAFGLLNTPSGTTLMVTKNLRMCGDCHSSTEIMSRLEQRDIVVRDGYRVHRFVNGSCSCKGRP